jgi:hypothetical protein
MKTIYLGGVQPGSFRVGYSLGQALSKADRDHYLVALDRALTEADEIDAWLKANPDAKLKPTEAEVTAGSDIVISPYFTKWVNFLAIRQDMLNFKVRLKSEDPGAWTSLTDEEHKAFGWVSVVDTIYSSFKSDPKNLTAGKWVGGVRQPDPGTPTGAVAMPNAPTTILGMDPQTAWIVGGVGLLGLSVAAWAMFRGK